MFARAQDIKSAEDQNMKRNKRNQRLLENVTEVSMQLAVDSNWPTFTKKHGLEDSIDARNFAIDAALAYHNAETRILRKAGHDEAAKYEWYECVDRFVGFITRTAEDIKPRTIATIATKAICGK